MKKMILLLGILMVMLPAIAEEYSNSAKPDLADSINSMMSDTPSKVSTSKESVEVKPSQPTMSKEEEQKWYKALIQERIIYLDNPCNKYLGNAHKFRACKAIYNIEFKK